MWGENMFKQNEAAKGESWNVSWLRYLKCVCVGESEAGEGECEMLPHRGSGECGVPQSWRERPMRRVLTQMLSDESARRQVCGGRRCTTTHAPQHMDPKYSRTLLLLILTSLLVWFSSEFSHMFESIHKVRENRNAPLQIFILSFFFNRSLYA